MPKRKASATVRRSARRRNYRAKRIRRVKKMPRRRIPLALKPHTFCERALAERTITINTEASSSMMGETFSLSKMRQADEYAAIFEFYRIDKIVATFRYKNSSRQSSTTSYNSVNEVNPLLYFKVDHNDITSQTVDELKDSLKTKTHMFTNSKPEFSIQLRPAIQDELYKSSLTTTYTPKWGQWLPCSEPSVPHYGLKAHCCAFKDANWDPGNLEVSFKYYVSFKNNE